MRLSGKSGIKVARPIFKGQHIDIPAGTLGLVSNDSLGSSELLYVIATISNEATDSYEVITCAAFPYHLKMLASSPITGCANLN
jgi:hypothetical protein